MAVVDRTLLAEVSCGLGTPGNGHRSTLSDGGSSREARRREWQERQVEIERERGWESWAKMDAEEERSDERCIQDVIAQFYMFFGQTMALKQDIEQLPELHESSRARIISQLESIESE